MTTLRDDRSAHRAEHAKAIFQHRTLILRYGAVQQTAQIAAARDLALFVRMFVTKQIPFKPHRHLRYMDACDRLTLAGAKRIKRRRKGLPGWPSKTEPRHEVGVQKQVTSLSTSDVVSVTSRCRHVIKWNMALSVNKADSSGTGFSNFWCLHRLEHLQPRSSIHRYQWACSRSERSGSAANRSFQQRGVRASASRAGCRATRCSTSTR